MTHIVIDSCVACKYTDCVAVCPVDCFYENDLQLVIDPEECIDCGACVPVCPVEAIFAEEESPLNKPDALDYNTLEAERLRDEGAAPVTIQRSPLPTAAARRKELGFE